MHKHPCCTHLHTQKSTKHPNARLGFCSLQHFSSPLMFLKWSYRKLAPGTAGMVLQYFCSIWTYKQQSRSGQRYWVRSIVPTRCNAAMRIFLLGRWTVVHKMDCNTHDMCPWFAVSTYLHAKLSVAHCKVPPSLERLSYAPVLVR